jgi:hypothetical protein
MLYLLANPNKYLDDYVKESTALLTHNLTPKKLAVYRSRLKLKIKKMNEFFSGINPNLFDL